MEKNNLHNEHPEAGNLLGSIPKKELQEAPPGYFDAFPEEIMGRIKSAPVFHAIEKRETMAQPDGYAESLHEQVMKTIHVQPVVKTTKIVSLPVKMFRWTAVAATLAILFTVGYYTMGTQGQPNETEIHIAENPGISHEECQHYLENETNIDDAIAYYVSEQATDGAQADNSAELDYLMTEEDIEFENY